ncbi:MAG TPA: hypothetical protein VFO85_01135 [Vicinamibacteria bacterium]|nr:hypothetical protein [Vicinamibacteria bacterium]
MIYKGFIGGSYESQSFTAAQMRTVNLYPERVEDPAATSPQILCPTPGVELITATNSTQGRAHAYLAGRELAVIGGSFLEIAQGGTPTHIGNVAVTPNPATLSYNGEGGGEVLITSGGIAYLYTLASGAFATISALNSKASMGAQLDGYFLVLDQVTGTMYSSQLLDGATWTTGTMFAQRNSAPDPWIAMYVHGSYIWLLGSETSEVWYDAGASPFPFAKHPSGLTPYGIAAPFSGAVCDNSLLWLGTSKSGGAVVMKASGFTPEPVSTYPVQLAMGSYDVVSDAYGDSYNEAGHTFYVLTFPSARKTWVYDLQMGQWHERGTWESGAHDYTEWGPRCHAFAFSEHRWLHGTGTGVYRSSIDLGSDVDSRPIRRMRQAPALNQENQRIPYTSLELDLDRGQGLVTGQGEDPQIVLQMSDDGGRTWGPEKPASMGKMGEYGKRVRWERLGTARRRAYRVYVTDPVPTRLTNAYLLTAGESMRRAG